MRVNNLSIKYKILNRKNEVIPPIIAREAYQRASILSQEELRRGDALKINEMFVWTEFYDGFNIWGEVYIGNYQPFYDFHKTQKAK